MFQTIRRTTRSTGRFLNGSAWFFIAASLVMLGLGIMQQGGSAGFDTDAALVGFGSGDGAGPSQALLFSTITLAAIGSVLPITRIRRIAHLVLVAWAGWWGVGLAGGAVDSPEITSVGRALLVGFLFFATLVRAAGGWRRRPVPTPVAIEPEPPTITSSARLHSDYEDLATDVAPQEKLMLRLRQVTSSGSVEEVDRIRRQRMERLRAVAAKLPRRVADRSRTVCSRESVDRARCRGAGILSRIASFTSRQADRLAPSPDDQVQA